MAKVILPIFCLLFFTSLLLFSFLFVFFLTKYPLVMIYGCTKMLDFYYIMIVIIHIHIYLLTCILHIISCFMLMSLVLCLIQPTEYPCIPWSGMSSWGCALLSTTRRETRQNNRFRFRAIDWLERTFSTGVSHWLCFGYFG